ncbi:MAG: 6-phosphofructokinase [Clostridiales Family XIII bacterium]|jgi:6-phosphofructokinase 1|nr:6-phosphofructokinase [Clostridiales Family XIII bacterium]
MADKKNMVIAQSGGPSSAINASIAGAISRAMAAGEIGKVYGAVNGMQGFLDRKLISISDQITTSDDIDTLIHTPAQALGSSRYKIPKGVEGDAVFARILEILKEYDIGYFFYNGGNDSMDTVCRVANYFKEHGEDIVAVGIPKTIDNDLAETDHTPGFGSAARYVAASVAEVYLDTIVYPLPAVTIVEVMGRNAGWLTAASVLARDTGVPAPHLIYLPELPFDPDDFVARAAELIRKEGQIVVAVSEGIKYADGTYIADTGAAEDMFGHKTLGGVASALESLLKGKSGISGLKSRAIMFSTLQRAAAHYASATDLSESYECGRRAVEAALAGRSGVMITIQRESSEPYLIRYAEGALDNIANEEKTVPLEWISDGGTNVSQEMVDYLRPLVRGEAAETHVGGLPRFFRFDWTKTVGPGE